MALEAGDPAERRKGGSERKLAEPHAGHFVPNIGPFESVVALVLCTQGHALLGVVPHLPQCVEEPVDEGLNVVFPAFGFDESLKVIVAVALGGHRPELTDDRDLGLRLKAIDLYGGKAFTAMPQCLQDALVVLEGIANVPFHSSDGAIRSALFNLVGANPVAHHVQHVSGEESASERHEELRIEGQADLLASGLLEAGLLLEENDSEPVEARIPKRLAVLGHVHPESARATCAGRQEDVLIDDLLGAQTFLVAQAAKLLHQVAHGEICGVTLCLVAELFSVSQRLVVGDFHDARVVTNPLQRRRDELVVGQGEAAVEDGCTRSLGCREEGIDHGIGPLLAVVFETELCSFLRFELR